MSRTALRPLTTLVAVIALAAGGLAPAALARHGADDPVGHDRGDDHGGQRIKRPSARHRADDAIRRGRRDDHRAARVKPRSARHGADDRPGHVRHGGDDGPNHR